MERKEEGKRNEKEKKIYKKSVPQKKKGME